MEGQLHNCPSGTSVKEMSAGKLGVDMILNSFSCLLLWQGQLHLKTMPFENVDL
jgi:hypothetical protein